MWKQTLLLFLDLRARFLDQILCFLYCGTRKHSFRYIAHVQGLEHVGLFQLYTTSLPCRRSRHVEYLHDIRCYCKQWDAAIISTIYASVAPSTVIKAWFVHSQGCSSGNSYTPMPELRITWCSISRTVPTNSFFNNWVLLLQTAIYWSHSSQCTFIVWYTDIWQP